MIQRYGYHYDSGLDADTLQPDDDGDWVLYNDHLAKIEEKDTEIERLNKELIDMSIQFQYQMEEMSKELADWKERWKNLYNLCT